MIYVIVANYKYMQVWFIVGYTRGGGGFPSWKRCLKKLMIAVLSRAQLYLNGLKSRFPSGTVGGSSGAANSSLLEAAG